MKRYGSFLLTTQSETIIVNEKRRGRIVKFWRTGRRMSNLILPRKRDSRRLNDESIVIDEKIASLFCIPFM